MIRICPALALVVLSGCSQNEQKQQPEPHAIGVNELHERYTDAWKGSRVRIIGSVLKTHRPGVGNFGRVWLYEGQGWGTSTVNSADAFPWSRALAPEKLFFMDGDIVGRLQREGEPPTIELKNCREAYPEP